MPIMCSIVLILILKGHIVPKVSDIWKNFAYSLQKFYFQTLHLTRIGSFHLVSTSYLCCARKVYCLNFVYISLAGFVDMHSDIADFTKTSRKCTDDSMKVIEVNGWHYTIL